MLQVSNAATWTIHSFKDNAPTATWSSSSEYWMVFWDLAFDLAQPDSPDSGFYQAFVGGSDGLNLISGGYQDTWTINIPDDSWLVRVDMYGPYPDYNGWDGHLYWPGGHAWNGQIIPPSSTSNSPIPGEYWIDYDSTGVARMSTAQPSDFGKWAWDGSINPSWVAAKKGYAKGHYRQPLPSPK